MLILKIFGSFTEATRRSFIKMAKLQVDSLHVPQVGYFEPRASELSCTYPDIPLRQETRLLVIADT